VSSYEVLVMELLGLSLEEKLIQAQVLTVEEVSTYGEQMVRISGNQWQLN
jgi:hypothetical protein